MRILPKLFISWIAFGIVLSCFSVSSADQKFKIIKKKSVVKKTKPEIAVLPDLAFMKKAKWSSIPKEGDVVGSTSMINIFIKNKGAAPSQASELKIHLLSFPKKTSMPSLNGMLNIPPLNPGQSFTLFWPQASSAKWPSGKFQFNFTIDPANKLQESVETNNKEILRFNTIPLVKKITKKKGAKLQNKALKVERKKSFAHSNFTGLAIQSPKPDSFLMAPRTYTIKYLAAGVNKISIDYLIYEVDSQGKQKDTFVTRSVVKNQAPTGSCDIQINQNMVPSRRDSGAGTFMSGSTQYFDGKVAVRLSAVVDGEPIEQICPLRVKYPRIRLKNPQTGTDLYPGLWYEARWSSIGHRLDNVKIHISKSPPGKFGFSSLWTIETPNTGKYRFRAPSDADLNIEIPTGGREIYLIVEEDFDLNLWNLRVISWKRLILH